MSIKVTVIGCGRMGGAILEKLHKKGFSAAGVEKDPGTINSLGEKGIECYETVSSVPVSEVYIVAVKPSLVNEVLDDLSPLLKRGDIVCSIAAGVRLESIKNSLPESAAAARVMPNTPLTAGEGMSCICFPGASAEQYGALEEIFALFGRTMRVDQDRMNTVTAVSGSGPAYFFLMGEVMEKFASDNGISQEDARILAGQTAAGAGAMMKDSTAGFGKLREDVTSPGGTTEAAVKHLKEKGFVEIFCEAMKKASERAEELSGSGETR